MAQSLDKFIVGVVIIGITLVIAMFIAATIQDATYDDGSGTSTNETLTAVDNITSSSFTYSTLNGVVCGDVSGVVNSTGFSIPSSNYTQTGCTVIASNVSDFIGQNWNVTYSYTYETDSATSNASGDLVTSLSGGSAWITILIVIGFATIVLGMLTSGLGKSAEQESAFTY